MKEKLFEGNVNLTVSKESFINKETGENIEYNAFTIEVAGEKIRIKFANTSDKKLLEYALGIR